MPMSRLLERTQPKSLSYRPRPVSYEKAPAACLTRWRGLTVSTRRAPEGIRTPNLLIRSQMLYPLSYGRMFSCLPGR